MDKKSVFKFLKNYTTDPVLINRLFVTAFLNTNKLPKPSSTFLKKYLIHEESDEFQKLLDFIKLTNTIDIENLIELFEFVVSPEDKIVNGAVYTPKKIREYITSYTFKKKPLKSDSSIADIACGCGSFLLTAAEELHKTYGKTFSKIFQENIYGLDIQDYSIERSKILLYLLALTHGEQVGEIKFNLYSGNALIFDWNVVRLNQSGFDFILGNPPYVCSRNMDAETKALAIQFEVSKSGHPDLYIPFFEVGINCLNEGGVLGFITVNSFFKSVNGRALRSYFQRNKYGIDIFDFGGEQVFNDRSTYTCLCFILKFEREYLNYVISPTVTLNVQSTPFFSKINWNDLDSQNGWILRDAAFIRAVEKTGIPFSKKYRTRNGIATLKNEVYIFTPKAEDNKYFYLDLDKLIPIEKGACADIVNSNKLIDQNVSVTSLQKIIFPYEFKPGNVRASLLGEQIFRKQYPNAYRYLESKKTLLSERDNGNGDYEAWFAFGRNQSLERMKFKLFFPHLTSRIPVTLLNNDENLLFYNGLAAISDNVEDLIILSRIFQSDIFWRYVIAISKPYSSGFFSLSRNYIKNFGIPEFTDYERGILLNSDDRSVVDKVIIAKYNLNIAL
ncbi:MAG: N-6 DNA methylase [Mucilaginibacter sp.]|jgi:methylase of polypeptide subunit release factors|uniref:class I SAM-dependent DNA methyltransferase n=1 Tax=Mucilaginibacter sp. TaxID=1882438 RepID=UPI003564601E